MQKWCACMIFKRNQDRKRGEERQWEYFEKSQHQECTASDEGYQIRSYKNFKGLLNLIHTTILLIRPTGFCNKGLFECIPIMSHWIYKTFIIFHICRTRKYLDTEHNFCSWKAINFWKVCAELIRILTSIFSEETRHYQDTHTHWT